MEAHYCLYSGAAGALAEPYKLTPSDKSAVRYALAHSNGTNGNDHHVDAIRPTVELVLGSGNVLANGNGNEHAAILVNSLPRTGYWGNGHHDEAPEPQQSLFSWAVRITD